MRNNLTILFVIFLTTISFRQELLAQWTLPNTAGSSTYNYGAQNINAINGWDVNANGDLRVNNLGPTGYLNEPNTTIETFTAYTLISGVDINVNSGGRFILGNDASGSGTRRANVYVTSGGTVHIKSGGTLRLTRGSQLIIEKGARLILDEGAAVDLWWSASKIQVQGELIINGDFDFGGSGYFEFDSGNTFTLNADFNLEGQNINHRFIHLNSGATLDVDNNAFNLRRGTVTYNSGSKIHVTNGADIKSFGVKFKNNDNSTNLVQATALHLENPGRVDMSYSTFENLYQAVEMENSPDTELLKFSSCSFLNNRSGIFGGGTPAIDVWSCTFDAQNAGKEGLNLLGISDVHFSGGTIKNYMSFDAKALTIFNATDALVAGTRFYDNMRSITLDDVPNFHMRGGAIEFVTTVASPNSSIGIYAPSYGKGINNTNIKLSGNAQIKEQEVGIRVDKGRRDLFDVIGDFEYGKVTMDCAKLIDNGTGIMGTDIPLYIDAFVHCNCTDINQAKPNSFIKSVLGGQVEDHFDICYLENNDDPIFQISAQGNYWSGGSDDNSYTLRATAGQECSGPNNIILLNDVQATEEPNGCSSGDEVKITSRNMEEQESNQEGSNEFEMTVYPNPTNGQFEIKLNDGLYNIVIYDLLGKVVAKENSASNSFLFNSSGWSTGLHIVTAIELSTNTRLQTRLLVQ